MASLVKNGNTYGLIWTDNSRSPRQVGESLKTSSKKEAKRRQARLENDYFTIIDGERKHDPWRRKWYKQKKQIIITIKTAVNEYLKYKEKVRGHGSWNDTTYQNKKYALRLFSRFTGSGTPLIDIESKDLEDFYYRDEINSDHTRNSLYITVNAFLNWCRKQGYIDSRPKFKPSKPQSKLAKFIWPQDFAKLIQGRIDLIESYIEENPVDRVNQYSWWCIYGWMILAGTGMRPIELANLKVNHVEDQSIIIGADFTTKVRAERRVGLRFESKVAADLLTDPKFRALEPYMARSPYLLGRSPKSAKDKLSRLFSESWKHSFPNKPKRVLYNLKDFFAVRFLSASDSGMAVNDLKEILGHSSIATTEKYVKSVPPGTRIKGTIWDYPTT